MPQVAGRCWGAAVVPAGACGMASVAAVTVTAALESWSCTG